MDVMSSVANVVNMLKNEEKQALQQALSEVSRRIEADQPLNLDEFSNEDLEQMYAIAYGHYQAGAYDKAQVFFHQLVISKPFKKEYWLGLGSCLQLQENYNEALQAWGMASILDSDDPMPHFHAAECCYARQDLAQTQEALKAAKKLLTDAQSELREKITQFENQLTEKKN